MIGEEKSMNGLSQNTSGKKLLNKYINIGEILP